MDSAGGSARPRRTTRSPKSGSPKKQKKRRPAAAALCCQNFFPSIMDVQRSGMVVGGGGEMERSCECTGFCCLPALPVRWWWTYPPAACSTSRHADVGCLLFTDCFLVFWRELMWREKRETTEFGALDLHVAFVVSILQT
jgi:hypothetical protein